ncbi:MAG: hypothetical protein Q7R56_01420 [Nanoarchaeota archaeon]|nr:hypothetical protein [Nanoarchaeota archaeon]
MKQGISEVISWVLLIGVTVILSIAVGLWIKEQTDQASKQITNEDYICNDIAFSATLSDCNQPAITLTIKNTGSFTITEFLIRNNGALVRNGLNIKPEDRLFTLTPGASISAATEDLNIANLNQNTKLELLPIITITTCTERRIIITCPST